MWLPIKDFLDAGRNWICFGNIHVHFKRDYSVGEFYSVALTNNYQQADTGTKMIHVGRNTKSTIISKGISAGLVKIATEAL